ncbi:MAG: DNA-3-methyladenine glycosylase [Tepidisphaera sp.]|nr:DNA-3-methyladenine glycosylase [Tepidisphaera sp.]
MTRIVGEEARRLILGPADKAARRLIGAVLVRVLPTGERLSGRIVETEAYLGVRDRASHAFGGRRTARNESMYRGAGVGYVYFTYGMHFCFNVVCGEVGEPAAVLVRAIEPLEGIELMRERRELGARRTRTGGTPASPAAEKKALRDVELCNGPGKLCQAMGIDRELDGVDVLSDGALRLELTAPVRRLGRGTRIGIDSAGAWAARRLRWVEAGSGFVSRPVGKASAGE